MRPATGHPGGDRRRRGRPILLAIVRTIALALAAAVLIAACAAQQAGRRDVLLATTTSFQDSGLLEVLVADFQKRSGYRVRPIAVGTGQALALGAAGDADVLVVHAPAAERAFMAAGNAQRRILVMHNDFVIVGPQDDPARVTGLSVAEALRLLADTKATFISRGDRSGTHLLEMELWKGAGMEPRGDWYVQASTGMGQTLVIASEKRAYTLSDRGTYLARRHALALTIVVERQPPLLNPYHVVTVDPRKFPHLNAAGANAFADYLVSREAQEIIGNFGRAVFGQPLFFPDAGKREEDLR